MNKKGQALVEFLIIVPVFLMLILAVFDYARIMQTKYDLETKMEDIVINDVGYDDDEVLSIDYNEGEKKYTLKKKVSIYSPVLSVFMGTKYEVQCERVVYE